MKAWLLAMVGVVYAQQGQDVTISARLGTQQAGGERLVVSVDYRDGRVIDLSPPVAQGLVFTPVEPIYSEVVGDRILEIREYRISGPAGSYEVLPLTVDWRSEEGSGSVSSYSLFIDHEVEATPPGELVDIVEPDVGLGISWFTVLGGGGLVALIGLGALAAFRSLPAAKVEEDEYGVPPHEAALARWRTVLADETLSVDEKAFELSALFREYLEAQLHFPASAWTTTESMEHLAELIYLDAQHLQSAKRILRATDWVKYAGVSTHAEALRALDSDLNGFIEATKPHFWGNES